MSVSRIGEPAEWFTTPGYVYVTPKHRFNVGIWDTALFCEIAMRALAQSGELSASELEACEEAFRVRFDGMLGEQE